MADASVRGSGIYAIRNKLNGKLYVGSALNIQRRWWQHQSRLRIGNHHSRKLQSAWNKYGVDGFLFEVLELVPDAQVLTIREQHWINSLGAHGPSGYNMRPTAESSLGVIQSDETKAIRSALLTGRKLTDEHKKKIALSITGRTLSESARKKISDALKGRSKGPMSDETRAKMSKSRLGVKHGPMSQEQKDKLSKIHKGRKKGPPSEETRAKISKANLGKKYKKKPAETAA